MEKIQWLGEYNIGLELIDTQHQKLVEILNNLNEIKKEKNIESLIRVFHDLICYSRIHFFDEEEIMKKINYPKYEEHKLEHKFFIDKLESYSRTRIFLLKSSFNTFIISGLLSIDFPKRASRCKLISS